MKILKYIFLLLVFVILFLIPSPTQAVGNWQTYTTSNSYLSNNDVRTLSTDADGSLWIGTYGGNVHGGGVMRYDGFRWTPYVITDIGLPSEYIYVSAVDNNGIKWFGTGGGVGQIDCRGTAIYRHLNSNYPWNATYGVTVDNNNTKWFGTGLGGLAKLVNYDFYNALFTTYNTSNSGLPTNALGPVAVDTDNSLWITTGTGGYGGYASLVHSDGSTWTVYTTSNSGLPSNIVRAVHIDTNGVKWFGTAAGLARYDGTNWTVYNTSNSGLPSNVILAIKRDISGHLWIGTDNGTAEYDGTNWTVYNTSNSGLPSNIVRTIAIGHDNSKWFGTPSGFASLDGPVLPTQTLLSVNTPTNCSTVNTGGPYTVEEGQSINLTASITDNSTDPVSYIWDLNNDDIFETLGQTVIFSAVNINAPATQTVRVKVTQGTRTPIIGATVVNIIQATNHAPTADAGGPYDVNEGGTVLVSATGQDPENGSLTYAWDLDNNGSFETLGQSVTFSATGLDGPDTKTIAVQVTDNGNLTGTDIAVITIHNVAPIVGVITAPTTPQQINTSVNASASFTDDGTLDSHSAIWNWGDNNTSSGIVLESNGSGSATGSHTYTSAGVYTVLLTITDDDFASGTNQFMYIVVYNPSGGFLTGAGRFNAPTGSIPANPGESGMTNFGANAKYVNSTLTGSTRLNFRNGQYVFGFDSTSYDWLVITNGNLAQLHGSGTVNGIGNYTFELTVLDNAPDTIRMQIWDSTNTVVYDNNTSSLTNGNVEVHN